MEPSEHAEKRNALEAYLRRIPGFRGYLDKEYRRESDAMVREWLGNRLQRSKRGIDEFTRPLAEAGKIELLPQVDRLRGRLDKLIGRIRGAMQGYSGFFDLVAVTEDRLDDVYDHDLALMDEVEAVGRAIEQLPSQTEQFPAVLPELMKRVDALERRWDVREDMLNGWEEPLNPGK